MGIKFQFHEKKCTGCFACHTACLDAHCAPEEKGQSLRAIKRVVIKEESFQKEVCPGCIHCGACVKVCPCNALFVDESTRLVLANQEACAGCGACEKVCPIGVIKFNPEGKVLKCDGCITRYGTGRKPACVQACPTGAITMETNEG